MKELIKTGMEVPIIGELIKLIVVIAPPLLTVAFLVSVLGIGSDGAVLILASLVFMWWLRVLEKWMQIRMVVPIIRLPWLWICWAGIAFGFLMLIGIA